MNAPDTSDLGRYGVFCYLTYLPPAARDESAKQLEELGFGAIWLANALTHETAPVLAATSGIAVGVTPTLVSFGILYSSPLLAKYSEVASTCTMSGPTIRTASTVVSFVARS